MITITRLPLLAFGTRRTRGEGTPSPDLQTEQTVNRLITDLAKGTYHVVPLAMYQGKAPIPAALRHLVSKRGTDSDAMFPGFKHLIAEIRDLNGENYLCEAQVIQHAGWGRSPAKTNFLVRLIHPNRFLSAGFRFPSGTNLALLREKDLKLNSQDKNVRFLDWTFRDNSGNFLPILVENKHYEDKLLASGGGNLNYIAYKGDLELRRQTLWGMLQLVSAVTALPVRYRDRMVPTPQDLFPLLSAKSRQMGVPYETVLDACRASGVSNRFWLSDRDG